MEKPIKTVLIISYTMIPYAPQWGGCQRMYFLAEYLQNQGFFVNVLHSKEKYRDFGMPINFHPIPVGPGFLPNYLYESTSVSKGGLWESTINNLMFIIEKLKIPSIENFIFNENTPGLGIIGYLFTRVARNCVKKTLKEHSIKYVIISAPPFSLFGFAPFIKKHFPDIRVIFDYRDPWNAIDSPYISTLKEKKYLKYADKVVFLNDRMLVDSIQKYDLPESKCETVLNGYSKKDWEEAEKLFLNSTRSEIPVKNRMVISYIGSGNFSKWGIRTISTFFDAFEIFQKNKKVLLRFVGIPTSQESEEIKQRFHRNIEIIPAVSLQTSLNYMLNSDVQLLIHTQDATAKYVLTGKLFDYIRSGKVIFGIGSQKDTYFLDWIEKYSLGLGCLNQSTEILKNLEILYNHWENGTLNQLRQDVGLNIEEFSRDMQNAKYLKIFSEL
jgi:glycosyltransferase involved in cell wall biosynthesis